MKIASMIKSVIQKRKAYHANRGAKPLAKAVRTPKRYPAVPVKPAGVRGVIKPTGFPIKL